MEKYSKSYMSTVVAPSAKDVGCWPKEPGDVDASGRASHASPSDLFICCPNLHDGQIRIFNAANAASNYY